MLGKILPNPGVIGFNCCGASKGWMRIRVAKESGELHVWVWPEPWSFEKTEPALIYDTAFSFDEAGFAACDAWLDEMYARFPPGNPPVFGMEAPEEWKAAFRKEMPQEEQTQEPEATQSPQEPMQTATVQAQAPAMLLDNDSPPPSEEAPPAPEDLPPWE